MRSIIHVIGRASVPLRIEEELGGMAQYPGKKAFFNLKIHTTV